MNWMQKAWNYFMNEEEEIVEVPRHVWVNSYQFLASASNYLGKRVEIPVDSPNYGGQTNVVGRLVTVSYDSSNKETTLEVRGPHFIATVNLNPQAMIMVHL